MGRTRSENLPSQCDLFNVETRTLPSSFPLLSAVNRVERCLFGVFGSGMILKLCTPELDTRIFQQTYYVVSLIKHAKSAEVLCVAG